MFQVHLIRSGDISDSFYDQIASLLQQFPGPMRFTTDGEYAAFLLKEDEIKVVETNEDDFYESADVKYSMPCMDVDYMAAKKAKLPPEIKVAGWDSLFKICRKFRRKKGIPSEDRVILLTGLNNEHNWFSAADPKGENNFFIHTEQWNYYIHSEARFPVAYLAATGILKKLAFVNYDELNRRIHENPRGCISDFCRDKREIILKMRTADICTECMEVIRDKKIDRELILQCFRIMEHIRTQLLFRERYEVLKQPSRIVITRRREPLQFPDLDNSSLRLSPIEKTIFILFLENPDGIHFNRMDEHRERLNEIYDIVGHDFTLANKINTLDRITNPIENRLSEITSRIRRKMIDHLGEELSEHYCIEGPNGEAKKVTLPRNLVVWEGIQPVRVI